MGDAHSKPETAVQAVLYGPAPFFAYPWKPLLNILYGGAYKTSYSHFRKQHMDGINLLLHCLCLVWQLSSNYALLAELDRCVGPCVNRCLRALGKPATEEGGRVVTRCTTLFWCMHLLSTSPTPISVKMGSVLAILSAHNHLGAAFSSRWRAIIAGQSIVEALAVQTLLLRRQKTLGMPAVIYFVARMVVWRWARDKVGCLREQSVAINTALVAVIAAVAASKQPLSAVAFGLVGWLVALLTDSKKTYLWSAGMTATLCQGVAHHVAGEQGTLELLQGDEMNQTSYELSHVTFFPNLLFHACYSHLRARRQ
eukprot:TRINITY_DN8996_c0_g2_i1.p1 TRINITY_DN8996_c0_g2~~TRINITY_DN8996_c0_g2_i1.p1  ORF type:complete len:311 (-),score=51.81 TRINITY_DN8996_c0_g2_i1:126-1058(-)